MVTERRENDLKLNEKSSILIVCKDMNGRVNVKKEY